MFDITLSYLAVFRARFVLATVILITPTDGLPTPLHKRNQHILRSTTQIRHSKRSNNPSRVQRNSKPILRRRDHTRNDSTDCRARRATPIRGRIDDGNIDHRTTNLTWLCAARAREAIDAQTRARPVGRRDIRAAVFAGQRTGTGRDHGGG